MVKTSVSLSFKLSVVIALGSGIPCICLIWMEKSPIWGKGKSG